MLTVFGYRTDVQFSPDDKLVVTGLSVKPGEDVGRLVFMDRQTLQTVSQLDVFPGTVSQRFSPRNCMQTFQGTVQCSRS